MLHVEVAAGLMETREEAAGAPGFVARPLERLPGHELEQFVDVLSNLHERRGAVLGRDQLGQRKSGIRQVYLHAMSEANTIRHGPIRRSPLQDVFSPFRYNADFGTSR